MSALFKQLHTHEKAAESQTRKARRIARQIEHAVQASASKAHVATRKKSDELDDSRRENSAMLMRFSKLL